MSGWNRPGGTTDTSPPFIVNAPAGYAGYLLRLQVNGADEMTVDQAGNITGSVLYAPGSGPDTSAAGALVVGNTNATSITLKPNTTVSGTLTVNGASITGGAELVSVNLSAGNAALNLGTGAITSGAVNGQTISAAANLTGSLTVATGITITASGLTVTAGGLTVSAGGMSITGNAGANAVANTIDPSSIGGITAETIAAQVTGRTFTLTGSYTSNRYVYFQQPNYQAATALTLTNGATVAIQGAPVAGGAGPLTITNPYALWVQAGNVRFDSGLGINSAPIANGIGFVTNATLLSGGNTIVQLNTGGGTSAVAIGNPSISVTAEARGLTVGRGTTLTITTGYTNQRMVLFQPDTLSIANAQTVTTAATVAISNAPSNGGAGTLTNAYALWLQAGIARFDGGIDVSAQNIKTDTTTGTRIGTGTTQKLSLFNGTPVVQAGAITKPASTASTNVTPFGYTTSGQADAIVTAVRALIDAVGATVGVAITA